MLFLDPFRLEFMDYMKGPHEEIDRSVLLKAGLQAPENTLPKYHREQLLGSILQALKPRIVRSTLKEKDWNKLAWVYDRIAAQLGVPPAKSYR